MPKKNESHPRILRGMDGSRRTDLVSPEQWFLQHNMRLEDMTLSQFPRLVYKYGLGIEEPVLELETLPGVAPGYGKVVALTESALYRLNDTDVTGLAANFGTSSEFYRWATVKYAGKLWFCNPANNLASTDGTTYTQAPDSPRAYQLAVQDRHLLMGNFDWKGQSHANGVAWSNLWNVSDFQSSSTNEADYTILDEYERPGESVGGVTGLASVGNAILAYTSTGIYIMQYGNKTFQTKGLTGSSGCGFLYGLAAADGVHVFPDLLNKNFFSFTGQGLPEPIGNPIKDYFFNDLNSAPELQQRTFAIFDPHHKEIVWCYVSTASAGPYDKAVVLSWQDKGWSVRSLENVNCFTHGIRLDKKNSELTGTNSALTGSNRGLGRTSAVMPRIWGGKAGLIFREEVASDPLSVLVKQCYSTEAETSEALELPVLETGDFAYGDLVTMKELDGLVPHANWTNASLMKVEVAVRDNSSEAVTWIDYGTYDKDSSYFRCDHPAKVGRFIRFRFTPITTGAASTSTKDFSSGSTTYPTLRYDYDTFMNWDVTGFVDCIGVSQTPQTYNDILAPASNGVYLDLAGTNLPFYNPVNLLSSILTSKSSYTFTVQAYRFQLVLAGNNRVDHSTTGNDPSVTISAGALTKTWVQGTDFDWNDGFATFFADLTPAGGFSAPIKITHTFPVNGDLRGILLKSMSVTEVIGGAEILVDDFEVESSPSGFTTDVEEGGGVRGFRFDSFAEKVRETRTER